MSYPFSKLSPCGQWFLLRSTNCGVPESLADFAPLFPPRPQSSWATPFPVEEDGRRYVFFEEIPADSPSRRGRICLMELDDCGVPAIIKPIIEQPCHLSYPFVLKAEDEWYLLLANERNRSVDLYRCTCWPEQWRLERTLLRDVSLVAPTLHFHGGYWWLFGGAGEGDSPQQRLHLYYAKHLCSPLWEPHPLGSLPPCAGLPAGRLFLDEQGRLLRPAREYSTTCGCSVVLNHVIELSPEVYREEPLHRFTPTAGQWTIRTFNHAGTSIWIDASFTNTSA